MNLYVQNPNDIVLGSYQLAVDSSLIVDATVTGTVVDFTPGGTITDATNASPIVITSAAHGLSNGDQVYVSQVDGNYNANGLWTVANVTTNTFELSGSSGSGAYLSGGTWYRPVAGAAGVAMAYNTARREYRGTISQTIPLTAGAKYIAMIDSDYGEHWESPSQALIRQ